MKQYYKALPTPLSEDDDEPGFHDAYHYGLVEYALFDLYAQDAESNLALAHWQAYLGYETQLYEFTQRRAGMPLMHGVTSER